MKALARLPDWLVCISRKNRRVVSTRAANCLFAGFGPENLDIARDVEALL